jgi:tape measure domain-containing protein
VIGQTTTERLVAEFSADTKAGERSFNALLGLIDRVDKMLNAFDGVDKYSKKFEDGSKKVEKSYRDTEGKTKDHVGRINRILNGIISPVDKLTKALSGKLGGGSGGFLPMLSNISQIIQGIPQVGQLAHALISPLTDAAEEGIKFNAFLESARMGFEGMFAGQADATQKAQAYIDKLQKFATKTPFQFEDLVGDAQLMKAFGFELDDVIPKLESWGNVVASSGNLSKEAIEGVVVAMGQMRTKGKVSAEEMNQLLERNVPAWELLAKAIGKSVAETQKLSERGKLRGKEAVDAMTAMINADPRYAGMMDKLSNSLSGRLSNLQDTRQQALGYATRNMSQSLSNSLGSALENSNLALEMGQKLDGQLKPIGTLIEASSKMLLGGSMIEGLTSGLESGKAIITPVLQSLALDTLVGGMSKFLGINSPAKTMIPLGESMAEGIAVGIDQGVDKFLPDMERSINRLVDSLYNGSGKGRLGTQQLSGDRIEQLVKEAAASSGLDPAVIRAVIHKESHGRADALSRTGNMGLMQISSGVAAKYGATDPYDPRQNVLAGSKYLAELVNQFHGDLQLALAAYNAGPTAVRKAGGIPNYGETKDYVSKVGSYLGGGGGFYAGGDSYKFIEAIGHALGFNESAGKEEGHNPGSLHGKGMAVDFSLRRNPGKDFDAFMEQMRAMGLHVKDERIDPRPIVNGKRQGVWTAPHVHISAPDGWVPLLSKGGGLVAFVEKASSGGDLTGGTGQFIEKATAKAEEAIKTDTGIASGPTELPHAANINAEQYLKPLKEIGPTIEAGFKQGEAAAGSFYDKVVMQNAGWIQDVRSNFISSFEGMFSHIQEGWRATLGSFVLSFLQALQQMATAALAARIGNLIFGTQQSDGTSKGGIFGKLVGWVTGALFGGMSGGGAHASGGGAGSGSFLPGGVGFGTTFAPGFADGGFLKNGPGTSRSDSLWGRLSVGEGVINADATQHYGGEHFINALNSKVYPRFAFASGGVLDRVGIARPSRRDYQRPISEGRERYEGVGEQHWHVTQNFPVTSNMAQLAPQPLRKQGQQAYAGIRRATRRGGPVTEE